LSQNKIEKITRQNRKIDFTAHITLVWHGFNTEFSIPSTLKYYTKYSGLAITVYLSTLVNILPFFGRDL
jgi:hypothetical protein